ncbi:MAG: PBP1A family penicillin-binding protein [Desulfobacterales bacterium]|nr:PBP1A family penicillin-binding protein [Desulfobacterales bacterium]
MTPAASFLRRLSGLFYLGVLGAACAALALFAMVLMAVEDLPRIPDPLRKIIETPPTEIFAASGERIMVLGGREFVPLDQISPHFIQAVVATEDHRFWEHHGVDKLRTVKALWITLFEPGRIQGASTISQQLAKNLFFSFERSYGRKFKELLAAFQIEHRYSKREILEAYLNQIPFGPGAYGIEQAARRFFQKSASRLTLAESALLAGLPKSPTRYNPFLHFNRARARQRTVLGRMAAVGTISADQVRQAAEDPLQLADRQGGRRTGSYFIDAVVQELESEYGPEVVYHGGLRVTTTLDPRLQSAAVRAVAKGLTGLDKLLGVTDAEELEPGALCQGALVALETHSGAVKAMVGGRNYLTTTYNRAVQNNRQPGSGFKPFLYYAAMETLGLSPAAAVVDRSVTLPVVGAKDWRPRNFERRSNGPMILKAALMHSVNTVAAQLVADTGPDAVIDVARRCGVRSQLDRVYSVALGTSPVSPMEMAAGFATFATGGIHHAPFLIWRVEDVLGRVLDERIVGSERVLDPGMAFQVVDMMQGVMDAGTGATVRRMGFDLPAAGKTGTTNDYKDAWFTGFTPTLSTSVWVGFDRQRGLRMPDGRGITGGRGAAPIWADFMIQALAGEPVRRFPIPSGIRFETVDPLTGCTVTAESAGSIRVALRKDQTPCNPEETGAAITPAGQ